MFVSKSAFSEVLRDLCGVGSICLPCSVVSDFVAFCGSRGVYPSGGALVMNCGQMCQYLYL